MIYFAGPVFGGDDHLCEPMTMACRGIEMGLTWFGVSIFSVLLALLYLLLVRILRSFSKNIKPRTYEKLNKSLKILFILILVYVAINGFYTLYRQYSQY